MRGRSGRTASGGGSASVGSGSTASSGGSSDISRNLTRGLLQNRSPNRPVDEEAPTEPVEGGDHRRAEERDQHDVADRPEGVVDKRGREVEAAEAADQIADSKSGRPTQRGRRPGEQQRPLPEIAQEAKGHARDTAAAEPHRHNQS